MNPTSSLNALAKSKRAAVIDVGSNSFLLVVGQACDGGPPQILSQDIRMPRLAQGMQAGGLIQEDALERGVQCMGELLGGAEEFGLGASQVRVVATAALRRAKNGREVAAQLEQASGCSLEILSGEEEARLSHLAVAMGDSQTLAVDVGGGSTEVVWAAGTERKSLDLGALTLTERFDGKGLSRPESFAAARAWARAQFSELPKDLGGDHPLALIGGSAVNLGCLVLELDHFDHTQADRVWASTSGILALAQDLWLEDLASRRSRPIEADRASFLPAGLLCLGGALEALGVPGGWTRTVGLAHGLLGELLD